MVVTTNFSTSIAKMGYPHGLWMAVIIIWASLTNMVFVASLKASTTCHREAIQTGSERGLNRETVKSTHQNLQASKIADIRIINIICTRNKGFTRKRYLIYYITVSNIDNEKRHPPSAFLTAKITWKTNWPKGLFCIILISSKFSVKWNKNVLWASYCQLLYRGGVVPPRDPPHTSIVLFCQ